jgi:cytochrome c biogenesis protein CcdA
MIDLDFPILLGVSAAIAHVLTGPDHLAAVTPLVFDTNKRHWRVGFSWGVGHLIGMLLIGVLFYFFKDYIPVESISGYSEQFVGIILIGVGLWSFYRIKNRKKNHKHPHFHEKSEEVHIHSHNHQGAGHHHKHTIDDKQNLLTAVGIGVIHGFAGIAHFVLLLPVLGFDSKVESLQYMLGFAIGIVFAMVLYTFVIGKINNKKQKQPRPLYYNLQFWSGILAILVGLYWVIAN